MLAAPAAAPRRKRRRSSAPGLLVESCWSWFAKFSSSGRLDMVASSSFVAQAARRDYKGFFNTEEQRKRRTLEISTHHVSLLSKIPNPRLSSRGEGSIYPRDS